MPLPRPDSRFLAPLTVSLLALLALPADWNGPARAADTLFCIGSPDGHCAEFALAADGTGYTAFSQRFPNSIEYVIGKNQPASWPYIHPAPRDSWAGGKTHTFTIEFDAPQTYQKPLYLELGLAGAHPNERSLVTIDVSGHELAPQTAPNGATNVLANHNERGVPKRMVFAIPPGVIRKGLNHFHIRLDQQSWIIYDYVALRASDTPLKLQDRAAPDLLTTFRQGPMSNVEEIVFRS